MIHGRKMSCVGEEGEGDRCHRGDPTDSLGEGSSFAACLLDAS